MMASIVNYLEWKQIKNPTAGKNYRSVLIKLNKGKTLEDLQLDDIINFLKKAKEKYSPATVAWYANVIRNFVRYWYNRGELTINPTLIESPKYRQNPYAYVTELDFNIMDDFLATEKQNFATKQKRLIIRFLWETGVRVGELVSLKYKGLLDCRTLIANEKNNNYRWIFWSTLTQELLDDFLKERILYNGEFLFVTFEGKMSTRCVERFLRIICGQLGITKHYVPHSFRHGKAHHILKKGGDVKSIQAILGHQNPVSSFRYLNLDEDETQKMANRYLT